MYVCMYVRCGFVGYRIILQLFDGALFGVGKTKTKNRKQCRTFLRQFSIKWHSNDQQDNSNRLEPFQ